MNKKRREVIQAQVEHFADVGLADFSQHQAQLLSFAYSLAEIDDFDDLATRFPVSILNLVTQNKQRYIDVLRCANREDLAFRIKRLEEYNTVFKPLVSVLKKKIMEASSPSELKEFRGAGTAGIVYAISINNKEYAVKFIKNIKRLNFEINSLKVGMGVEKTAQLISYSTDDRCIITEMLPGENVTEIPSDRTIDYPEEQIIALIETVIALYEKGGIIDPNAPNFMYDSKKGFSVLDYNLKTAGTSISIARLILWLRLPLCARKWPDLSIDSPDYRKKEFQMDSERYQLDLKLMVKLLGILSREYPKILKEYRQEEKEKSSNPILALQPLINRNTAFDFPEKQECLDQLEAIGF